MRKYARGDVVRLKEPIVEATVGEDHGSSIWVFAGGMSGYLRKDQIEERANGT